MEAIRHISDINCPHKRAINQSAVFPQTTAVFTRCTEHAQQAKYWLYRQYENVPAVALLHRLYARLCSQSRQMRFRSLLRLRLRRMSAAAGIEAFQQRLQLPICSTLDPTAINCQISSFYSFPDGIWEEGSQLMARNAARHVARHVARRVEQNSAILLFSLFSNLPVQSILMHAQPHIPELCLDF